MKTNHSWWASDKVGLKISNHLWLVQPSHEGKNSSVCWKHKHNIRSSSDKQINNRPVYIRTQKLNIRSNLQPLILLQTHWFPLSLCFHYLYLNLALLCFFQHWECFRYSSCKGSCSDMSRGLTECFRGGGGIFFWHWNNRTPPNTGMSWSKNHFVNLYFLSQTHKIISDTPLLTLHSKPGSTNSRIRFCAYRNYTRSQGKINTCLAWVIGEGGAPGNGLLRGCECFQVDRHCDG